MTAVLISNHPSGRNPLSPWSLSISQYGSSRLGRAVALTLMVVLSLLGCSLSWSVLDRAKSPDKESELVIETREHKFELRLKVTVLRKDESFTLQDNNWGWYVTGTHIAWTSDSSRVAAIVCQTDDPTFFGFDLASGKAMAAADAGILAAQLVGRRAYSAEEASLVFKQICGRSRCDQRPCGRLSTVNTSATGNRRPGTPLCRAGSAWGGTGA